VQFKNFLCRASHVRRFDGFLPVCVDVNNKVIQVIPGRVFIRLWQVVGHFLAGGKCLHIPVGHLHVVAEACGIVRRNFVGIRRTCTQGTKSAFDDLRSSLSSHALKQKVELDEVVRVRGILSVFAMNNVLYSGVSAVAASPLYAS